MRDANFVGAEASTSAILPLNGYSANDDSFANIPPEQLRMIQNINTLISEVPSPFSFISWLISCKFMHIIF